MEFEVLVCARPCATQYSDTAENVTGKFAGVAGSITGLQVPDHHQFSLIRETALGRQGNLKGNSSWTQG